MSAGEGIARLRLLGYGEVPPPLLDAELALWSRPPASACFALHPHGAVRLYDRARALLAKTGVAVERSAEEKLGTYTALVFQAGQPIRDCIASAVPAALVSIKRTPGDPRKRQSAYLALRCVVEAACAIAEGQTA